LKQAHQYQSVQTQGVPLANVESEQEVGNNMTKPLHKPGVVFERDVMSGAEALRFISSSS
jgi:hypothetical protein